MRVAIIDHILNQGGSSRVLRCLLPAIRKLRPDWELTFYSNKKAVIREGLQDELASAKVKLKWLRSVQLSNTKFFFGLKGAGAPVRYIQQKYKNALASFPYWISGAVHREIEKIAKHHDLIFYPWPYHVDCPKVSIPIVSIFHDFNFRYYFNGPLMPPFFLEQMRCEIPKWLSISTPIVSTHFMKSELEKFYPEFAYKARVIHLASLGAETKIDLLQAKEVVAAFGITDPYLLYPTNTTSHKNIGSLISAFALLRKKHRNLKLVLAGYGTEAINGIACQLGLEMQEKNGDVMGLGYVSNLQIDALIQCAALVVSTSLYEAGCGPGLDAWQRGVPVAMSNIPAFTEHLDVQGVKAEVFDPKSPADIAEKIDRSLSDPIQAKENALHSQKMLSLYDWEKVAEKYIAAFESARR